MKAVYKALFNYFKSNKLFTPFQSSYMKYKLLLITTLLLIREVYLLTSQKPLIKSGALAFHLNYNLMVLMVKYFLCWKITLKIISRGSFLEFLNKFWSLTRTVLVPLLFLICVNDLPDGITSRSKSFAGDISLFSKVLDVKESTWKLSFDLEKVKKSAFQWKKKFNTDPNKQANENIFYRKSKFYSYPPLTFSNNDIKKCPYQKCSY